MAEVRYNILGSEEMRMACLPLNDAESEAFLMRSRLRAREKTFLTRKMHRIVRALGEWILRNSLAEYHDELLAFASSVGTSFNGYKVYLLYSKIRKYRPLTMVEYGGGSSTALIAAMLEKNRRDFGVDGKLITFEQNEDFYNPMSQHFPESLRKRSTIVLSELGYEQHCGYREIFYRESPGKLPQRVDLVFIDGPASVPGMPDRDSAIFSGDLRRLAGQRDWGRAFTDIRYFNLNYFADVLPECCVRPKVWQRTIEVTSGR